MDGIDELFELRDKKIIGTFPLPIGANLSSGALRTILDDNPNNLDAAEAIETLQFPHMGSIVRYMAGDLSIPIILFKDPEGKAVSQETGLKYGKFEGMSLSRTTADDVKKVRGFFERYTTDSGLGYVNLAGRRVGTDNFRIEYGHGGFSAERFFKEGEQGIFSYKVQLVDGKPYLFEFDVSFAAPMKLRAKFNIYKRPQGNMSAEIKASCPNATIGTGDETEPVDVNYKFDSEGNLKSFNVFILTYTPDTTDKLIDFYTTGAGKEFEIGEPAENWLPPHITEDLRKVAMYQAAFKTLESLTNVPGLELTKDGKKANLNFLKSLNGISKTYLGNEAS